MKVSELVAWLQRQPQEAEVILNDDAEQFYGMREEQLTVMPKRIPPGIGCVWDSELVDSPEAPSVVIG